MSADDQLRESWEGIEAVLPRLVSDLEKLAATGDELTAGDQWKSADYDTVGRWHVQAIQGMVTTFELFNRASELNDADTENSIPRSRSCEMAIRRAEELGHKLREQTYASEMRLRLADPTGTAIDDALSGWKIEPSRDHRDGLEHILSRPPKRGTDARWRTILRQSKPEGFYRWLRSSTLGAARDTRRPDRKSPRSTDRTQWSEPEVASILSIVERAELTEREHEIVLAYAEGGRLSDAARRIGIKPSTARVHFLNAKRKIRGSAE